MPDTFHMNIEDAWFRDALLMALDFISYIASPRDGGHTNRKKLLKIRRGQPRGVRPSRHQNKHL
jgi:hypothetical protein